jgi:hypothetical protein
MRGGAGCGKRSRPQRPQPDPPVAGVASAVSSAVLSARVTPAGCARSTGGGARHGAGGRREGNGVAPARVSGTEV